MLLYTVNFLICSFIYLFYYELEEFRRFQEEKRKKQAKNTSHIDLMHLSDKSTSYTEKLDEEIMKLRKSGKNIVKRRTQSIISPELASALDRTNVTDRQATYLLAAAAKGLGHVISDFFISRDTIRRAKITNRNKIATTIKFTFNSSNVPLTVHFVGKILPDITGRDSVDRLAVVVTGYNVDQLLGILELTNGTGKEVSEADITTLLDWDIQDRVKAMSFDTTAANTGTEARACTLVEKKLDREVLHLACRHHMYEVVLSDVFKHSLGQSSGPEIGSFKRFRDKWSLK